MYVFVFSFFVISLIFFLEFVLDRNPSLVLVDIILGPVFLANGLCLVICSDNTELQSYTKKNHDTYIHIQHNHIVICV
jgi:hypothetical protein